MDVEATSGGAGYSSEALSGAAASVGVAGSLGLTIANVKTLALLTGSVSAPAVDATFKATSTTTSSAKATAGTTGSGVGASVAIDLVTDTTQAALADGSA